MIEKMTVSRVIFNVLNYTFMIALCLVCVAPIWHVLMASFSDPRILMGSSGILWKPVGTLTTKGYELVFANSSIMTGYLNTLIYVGINTVLGTCLTMLAGYVLSRPNMKLKVPMTLLVLFTMMFNGGLIPSYMINRSLGLVNSRLGVILPGLITAYYIIIVKSAFEQLSPSYEESAKLDGAGPLTTMVLIMLPLVKATVAVIIMYILVQQWNS